MVLSREDAQKGIDKALDDYQEALTAEIQPQEDSDLTISTLFDKDLLGLYNSDMVIKFPITPEFLGTLQIIRELKRMNTPKVKAT